MGCCFETASSALTSPALDPSKHVNYVLGMVLGESDFRQEFAYLSGRDQWLARDLVGYGTVRGLALRVDIDGANGPRVYVDSGVAVTPSGQLVCVPTAQCANVNAWLGKNTSDVLARIGSPAERLRLYVVLCYRECPADDVPIPGEPCRTEEELMKPSRMRDDFCLELLLEPPKQREEVAVRDFCEWLRRVDMCAASSTPLKDFLEAIRAAASQWLVTSPPGSPPEDFMLGSPPGSVQVRAEDACEYLRAAFRLWVTELRPKWIQRWYGCAPNSDAKTPLEDCVLIGQIDVDLLSGGGTLVADDTIVPTVDESNRPVVLHSRMLQEWLLCGSCCCASLTPGGSAVGSPPDVIELDGSPPGAIVQLDPAGTVVAETTFGMAPVVGTSLDYARADHTHGTPTLPSLAGDVVGPIGGNRVNAFAGGTLPAAVGNGQVLQFNAGAWVPTALPTTSGQFVGRGSAQPYTIVAAGTFEFTITPAGGEPVPGVQPNVLSQYNSFKVDPYNPGRGFPFTFLGATPGEYIVKLTPWLPRPPPSPVVPFIAYFAGTPDQNPATFFIVVVVTPNVQLERVRLMVEVSRLA